MSEERASPFGAVEWALTGVIALVWGGSFLFIRVGLETFGPGLVPALRIAFGLVALGLVPASRTPIDRADWPRVAFLGLIWMALPFVLFTLAERTVPTAIAGMINGAVPLCSAAVAAFMQRRIPSLRRCVALLLGLAGVSVVALAVTRGPRSQADVAGVVMLFVAVLCYGISANVALPLPRRYGAIAVLFRVQMVALVASLPYAIVAAPTASFSFVGLGAMVFLGAVGTGLAYTVLATLVGRTDATRGTIGVFLTPIVATLLGVTLRHEELPAAAIIGALLILGGAILTSRPEPPLSKGASPPRPAE